MADCECESKSQSEHQSPGPVENPERLLRLCYTPYHILDNGRLAETALSKQDLIRKDPAVAPQRGCSVFRREYLDVGHVSATAQRQMAKLPEGQQARVYELVAAEVRALQFDGGRSVCVVDRALADDPSHAEFWGSRIGSGNAMLGFIRKQLVDLMNRGHSEVIEPPKATEDC